MATQPKKPKPAQKPRARYITLDEVVNVTAAIITKALSPVLLDLSKLNKEIYNLGKMVYGDPTAPAQSKEPLPPAPERNILGELVSKPFTQYTDEDWKKLAHFARITEQGAQDAMCFIAYEKERQENQKTGGSDGSTECATGIGYSEPVNTFKPAPPEPQSELHALFDGLWCQIERASNLRDRTQGVLMPVLVPEAEKIATGHPCVPSPTMSTQLATRLAAMIEALAHLNGRSEQMLEAIRL